MTRPAMLALLCAGMLTGQVYSPSVTRQGQVRTTALRTMVEDIYFTVLFFEPHEQFTNRFLVPLGGDQHTGIQG
jgi:hypothetical protein